MRMTLMLVAAATLTTAANAAPTRHHRAPARDSGSAAVRELNQRSLQQASAGGSMGGGSMNGQSMSTGQPMANGQPASDPAPGTMSGAGSAGMATPPMTMPSGDPSTMSPPATPQ